MFFFFPECVLSTEAGFAAGSGGPLQVERIDPTPSDHRHHPWWRFGNLFEGFRVFLGLGVLFRKDIALLGNLYLRVFAFPATYFYQFLLFSVTFQKL
jgi:hypothetical protein